MKLRQSSLSLMYRVSVCVPPSVGCDLNAEMVDKLSFEGVPVGERTNKLGLLPVPLGHCGETLVEDVRCRCLFLCDTGMLAISEKTIEKVLSEGTSLKDAYFRCTSVGPCRRR